MHYLSLKDNPQLTLSHPHTEIIACCPLNTSFDTHRLTAGYTPKDREELHEAIAECLEIFDDCTQGPNGPIASWDVSAVTDMNRLFISEADAEGYSKFKGDISKWDVSRVKNMRQMFYLVSLFDGDLSKWDVSSVTNMASAFRSATKFNSDISKWDVSRVSNMEDMFYSATSFKGDLSKWEVSRVTKRSGCSCLHCCSTVIYLSGTCSR